MKKQIHMSYFTIAGFKKGHCITLNPDGTIGYSTYNDSIGGGACNYDNIKDYIKSQNEMDNIIKIIDEIVMENHISYKEIYEHIISGNNRNSRSYLEIARHCAKKIGIPFQKVLDDFKIERENQKYYYHIDINTKKIKNDIKEQVFLNKKIELFYQDLEKKGISRKMYGQYPGAYHDKDGETIIIKEPSEKWNDYGEIQYPPLPIKDEDAIAEFLHQGSKEDSLILFNKLEDYKKRCASLIEELKTQGIHRDRYQHKYLDSNHNEVIINPPNIYDSKDMGSFSYKQKHELSEPIKESKKLIRKN